MKGVSFKSAEGPADYKGIRVMAVSGLHEAVTEGIVPILPKGSRVLELGCGAGALSQRLADAGYDILSADVDRDAFQAKTEFRQLDLSDADQMAEFRSEFSDDANKFDAAVCVEVIEHMENPRLLVRDIETLVRPGGVVLLSTPNVGSWYSRLRFFLTGKFPLFHKEDSEYGHIHAMTETELELVCQQAGLKVQKILPGGDLPRLWLSGSILHCLANIFGWFASFFMRGQWRGFCIIVIARKE